MTPESLAAFFSRPEWEYASRFLKEARESVLCHLWEAKPTDAVAIGRLQQEASTLTYLVGDHPAYESLRDALIEESKQFAKDAESEAEEEPEETHV